MSHPLKRSFDLAAATAGLIVTAPVIAGLAVTMAIVNRSNPFFMQQRVGQHGGPFKIIKIKTMRDAFDHAGMPLPDHQRTSKLGIIVRKTRLDELPQLWNVIKGDMSLVGPRPLVHKESDICYDPLRISVKPGITGVAQIMALNNMTFAQQLACDRAYIESQDSRSALQQVLYDVGVIVRTPYALITHWSAPHTSQNRNIGGYSKDPCP